jgi:hypothetical protein
MLLKRFFIIYYFYFYLFYLKEGCGVDWVLLAEEGVRWLPEIFHRDPIHWR